MARALWSGAISFGLINIPVEFHPAEERREFKFALLDRRDFSPVGYMRYSKRTGKEVAWDDIVKGYEYEKDQCAFARVGPAQNQRSPSAFPAQPTRKTDAV